MTIFNQMKGTSIIWVLLSFAMVLPIFIQIPDFSLFLNRGSYLYSVEGQLIPLGFLIFLAFALTHICFSARLSRPGELLVPMGLTIGVVFSFFSVSLTTPIGNLQAISLPILCVWIAFSRVVQDPGPFAVGLFLLPALHFISFLDIFDSAYIHRIFDYSFFFGYQYYSALVAYVDVYGVIAAYLLILFVFASGWVKLAYFVGMLAVLVIMFYSGQRAALIYHVIIFFGHAWFSVIFSHGVTAYSRLVFIFVHFSVVIFLGMSIQTELGAFLPYVFFSVTENLVYLSSLAVDEQLISLAAHEGIWSFVDFVFGTQFLEGVTNFNSVDPRVSLYGSMLEEMFSRRENAFGWREGGAGYHNLFGGLVISYGWLQLALYLACVIYSIFSVCPNRSIAIYILLLFILPNLVNVPASQPVYIIVLCLLLSAMRALGIVEKAGVVK